jgi:chemotaxis protein methyltransferase CheR
MELLKLSPSEFDAITKVVYDRTGIHLPKEKLNLLSNRLRKRLKALSLDSFGAYVKLVSDGARCDEELPHFLSAITTNETYFFRNEQLWNFLGNDLVDYFVQTKTGPNKSLRLWSAACSSGEEACTAGIVLRENLPSFSTWKVTIIGSDISQRVLDKAKESLYDSYAVSRTPEDKIKRWFTVKGDKYQLRDEIRKMVRFQTHNLRDTFPSGRFDLVFLRNVLMYFDNAMKKRVLEVVTDAVVPGGHVIIGDVDPIRTVPELSAAMKCEYQRPGVYRKPGGPALTIKKRQAVAT